MNPKFWEEILTILRRFPEEDINIKKLLNLVVARWVYIIIGHMEAINE